MGLPPSGPPSGPVITRAMLRDTGLDHLFERPIPGITLLTEAERAASLAGLLAARRERGGGAWVFAYGSLIWNPAMHYAERRFARVHGWHRSFCLSALAGRGTPEAPGLLLGLDRGGACAGAAFRIEEVALEEELSILWRREMVAGSYRPLWLRVRDEAGAPFGHAIAFTIRRDGVWYAGALSEEETIRRLATASGRLGTSAEYLLHTRDGLRSLGIVDRRIERLASEVETVLQLEKKRADPY